MTLRPLCPLILFFCTDSGAADQRLPFASPAEVGMSAETLGKIDEIVARKFIKGKQLAGASVLVARRG